MPYKVLTVNLVDNFALLKDKLGRETYDFVIVSEPASYHDLRTFSVIYHDPIYNEPNGDVMILVNRRYKVDHRKTLGSRNQLIVGLEGGLNVIGVHMSVHNNRSVIDWLMTFVRGNTIVAGDFNNTLEWLKDERKDLQSTDAVTTVKGSRIDNILLPVEWKGKYSVTKGNDHHLVEWIGERSVVDEEKVRELKEMVKEEDGDMGVEEGKVAEKLVVMDKKKEKKVEKKVEPPPLKSKLDPKSWYQRRPELKAHLPGCRHLVGDESTFKKAVKGEPKCGDCLRRR